MADPDVKKLLESARSGDRLALNRLLECCQDRLRALCAQQMGRHLRSRLRASDVLQSTYLEVLRDIGDFRGDDEKTFVSWVASILRNHVRRKSRFFGARRRKNPDTSSSVRLAPGDASHRVTPSAEIRHIEDLLTVSRALESLPEEQREIILMKVVDGRDHKEIAGIIGKSEAATRMLLSRARARLTMEIGRLEARPDRRKPMA